MKKELRKKGGKRGSPPIVEIYRTPDHFKESEKPNQEVISPIPSKEPKEEREPCADKEPRVVEPDVPQE